MNRMEDLHALLMDLWGSFSGISSQQMDEVLCQALEKIGRFVDADRVCVFLYATDHSGCINTHEWCREDIQPHEKDLKRLPVSTIAPLWKTHKRGDVYCVADTALVREEPLKTFLLHRQVQSMVAFPMMEQDTCLGFVSLDAVRSKRQLKKDETTLLEGLAHTMVKLIVQQRTEQKVQALSSEMEEKAARQLLFSSRDISHQKRQEEQLKTVIQSTQCFLETTADMDPQTIAEDMQMRTNAHLERTHREMFNSTVDALFIHDIETGDILDVNDTMLKMFGYNREELPELSLPRLSGLDAPFIEEKAKYINRQCEAGEDVTFEWVCRRKNGEKFHTENSLRRVTIAGQPRVMATVRDITDRKEMEDELKVKSHVLDQIQDRVIMTDLKGNITYVNQAEIHALGYSQEELLGASVHMLGKNVDPTAPQEAIFNETLQTGSWRGEVINRTKDGKELVYELRNQLILDHQGNRIALVGVSTDMTERIRQEAELRLQNGLITSLLHSIPDLVFYKDLEGVHMGGNQAFADQMGIPTEDIIGKTDYDLHPKNEADSYRYNDQLMLQNLESRHNEEWVTYPDGRKVLLDTMKTPYWDQEGNLIGILGIARDITQRKQAEEALKLAMQQAETANQSKSRYLAHMNHEMRTPLNGFLGFVHLMESTRLDEEQQNFMEHMKQSATNLLGIINNVLDMASIEAGQIKLVHRVFLLEEEIETALAPLRFLAPHNNTHLKVTMDEHLPRQVKGDPDRLRQILLNLGGNAVKFTRKGQVYIALTCRETTDDYHMLQLVVEDTGPGMTEETLDKLFQPFYQSDDGSKSQAKGTGLGLTITKELVELMGGTIQVDSTLGKGTRMAVTLKLQKGVVTADLLNF